MQAILSKLCLRRRLNWFASKLMQAILSKLCLRRCLSWFASLVHAQFFPHLRGRSIRNV